jgi:adenylylsulfate kinase
MIVVMAGLPGTGKSTIALALADRLSAAVLNKDAIRHALFSARDVEYSAEQDDFVMDLMLQTAQFLWLRDPARAIILDGRPFSRTRQIERVITFAEGMQQRWHILECVCSEEAARQRLQTQHSAGEHPAGNRDFQLYLAVKARFELITRPKTVLNTEQPVEICVNHAINALV